MTTLHLLLGSNPTLRFREEVQITMVMNKWMVSPPNAAPQFGWKQAAHNSTVQHTRGLHLWKCYYFVTKAFLFADHFNTPATESSIFMPTIILLEQASHFQTVNISLWNEAFRGKNLLFAVIALEWQPVAIWLLLHCELLSPQLFTPGNQNKSKKKKKNHIKMSYSWTHFIYFTYTLMLNTCFHANESLK